ncbi:hypothetical protein BGU93_18560 [Clostridioides difficile]|nr:hypothetical protein BGU93_18560 [Clostridioides difficile]
MADSYRKLVEAGELDKEVADKEIRIYDFLATCDSDDLCRMVVSSAFHDVLRAYLKQSVPPADIHVDASATEVCQPRSQFADTTTREAVHCR